jgi:glycine cleavage system H protein
MVNRASFLLTSINIDKRRSTNMNIPSNLKYSKTDEWFDPASGKMGLSDFAQSQLSDIVFVEIVVSAGDTAAPGKAIASVESVKAAAESYASASGKVVAVNESLSANPEILNSDPYGAGWMIQVEGGDASGLMDAAEYTKYCEERAH